MRLSLQVANCWRSYKAKILRTHDCAIGETKAEGGWHVDGALASQVRHGKIAQSILGNNPLDFNGAVSQ
jgi:hypothetical protein